MRPHSLRLFLLSLCLYAHESPGGANMKLESPAFSHNGDIPALYTCDGNNISPPLVWSDPPEGTRSLALIVDDPDAPDPKAPKLTWVHWVLYNLPPTSIGLPEAIAAYALPPGTRQGLNDWNRTGYGGPCPPMGRHRYFHKLYALDTSLPDLGQATKGKLEAAMQGHILAEAHWIGTYQSRRRGNSPE
jgi:Raf kinase inhibitor-like YbhB/YbcL family protein